MKLFARLILPLLALAVLAGCSKDGDSAPATLGSVCFFAADNAERFPTDICVPVSGPGKVVVKLPAGLPAEALTELHPSFVCSGKGSAKILVGGVSFRQGDVVDFSSAVPIEVRSGGKSNTYSIQVAVRQTPSVSWSDQTSSNYITTSNTSVFNDYPYLAVNPKDGSAYVAATSAETLRNERKVILFRIDPANRLEVVANPLSDRPGNVPSVGFDKEGIPYVAFADYTDVTSADERTSNVTVLKVLENGGKQIGKAKAFGGVYSAGPAPVIPVSDKDVWAASAFGTSGYKYSASLWHFDGGSWKRGDVSVLNSTAHDVYPRSITANGYTLVSYLSLSGTAAPYTVRRNILRFEDGKWSLLVRDMLMPRPDKTTMNNYAYTCIDYAVDAADNLYFLVIGDVEKKGAEKKLGLLRYAPDGTSKLIGSAIPDVTAASGANPSVAIDDSGTVFLSYLSIADGMINTCVRYFDAGTGDWSEKMYLQGDGLILSQLRFNSEGVGFIAARTSGKALAVNIIR